MKMASQNSIVLALAVVASLIGTGSTINCYYCNSANNSACIDVTMFEDEVRARVIPVVHCETAIPSPVAVNFFCRKIVQTIYHPGKDSEVRVTRGCGWIPHNRDCYRADNRDHLETVCQCFHDHCNSSDTTSPPIGVSLFLILAAVLYFYR